MNILMTMTCTADAARALVGGLIFGIIMLGCGDSPFIPEAVTKLRPLGSVSEPLGLKPQDAAVIVLHFATPIPDETMTVASSRFYYIDSTGAELATPASAGEVAEVASYATLIHKTVSFSLTLPSASELGILQPDGQEVFFKVEIVGSHGSIPIHGKVIVYPEGHEALGYQNPQIAILSPDAVANRKESKLIGQVTKAQEEVLKIGWLVPHGRVSNRRALETKWKPEGDSGVKTLVLTARGRTSQGMALMFKDVTIN